MASSELRIDVSGQEAFGRVSRELGQTDDRMPGDIKRVLRGVAEKMADEARAKVLAEPVHGIKQRHLRADIAAGVGIEETVTGVRITTSMPQANEAIIPRGMDRLFGWRHPVFGHRNKWVTQHAAFSWFMSSMEHGQEEGERKFHDLLEDAARRIADAARA